MKKMQETGSEVNASEIEERLAVYQRDCILLDVRESDEYDAGHIPGALNIPLSQLPSRLSELKKDRSIILICLSGGRARAAAKILAGRGCPSKIMTGGMRLWKGPIERTISPKQKRLP